MRIAFSGGACALATESVALYTRRLRALTPGLAGMLLLAACQDLVVEPSTSEPQAAVVAGRTEIEEVASARRVAAARGDRSRGLESDILRLEARVSAIGGISFDPELRQVVVFSTDSAADAAAEAAAREVYSKVVLGPDDILTSPTVVVRRATHTFSEVIAWSEVLLSRLVREPDFVYIDADERTNRVRVGVYGAKSLIVRGIAEAVGAPPDLIEIEEMSWLPSLLVAPPASTPTAPNSPQVPNLRQRIRPSGAGMQIMNIDTPVPGICSQGWTVNHGGVWRFLTASHCTQYFKGDGITGEPIYQSIPIPNDLIGTVTHKPPWNVVMWNGPCTHNGVPYPSCTYADAMLVTPSVQSSIDQRMAKPVNYQHLNSQIGSVDISAWWNASNIRSQTGEGGFYWPFTTGRKVGRTTGYTGGWVQGTCENWVVEGSLIGCMGRMVGASVGKGDSGGPVFGLLGTTTSNEIIYPFGITTAGGPLNVIDPIEGADYCHMPQVPENYCTLLYSRAANIALHFGATPLYGGPMPPIPPPFTATINGPTHAPPQGFCSFSASASGGTAPFSRQWWKDGVPVSTSTTYNLEVGDSDFFLELRMIGANGAVAWASRLVDVFNGSNGCPV